jgi:hypothetical protein
VGVGDGEGLGVWAIEISIGSQGAGRGWLKAVSIKRNADAIEIRRVKRIDLSMLLG